VEGNVGDIFLYDKTN